MKLFFQETYLGEIEGIFFNQPEVHGTFCPADGIDRFQQLFAWIVDERNQTKDPPFSDDLLDDGSWFVVDDDGVRRGITLPGVYADGEIIWRWRDVRRR